MTRLNAYIGKTTDMVSAFFLLLAVILAGGYAPSTAQSAAAQTSQTAPTDLGAGGHRSVPFISKQHLLASEAEDDKATSFGDGKAKAFVPARGFELAASPAAVDDEPQAAPRLASVAASPYEARAPPATS
ncbi:MAG TPA: hypothetical protein VIZ90_06665 [Rhizobiaceae bacterium]